MAFRRSGAAGWIRPANRGGRGAFAQQAEGDAIRPVEETIPVNIPWAEHFKQGLVSAL